MKVYIVSADILNGGFLCERFSKSTALPCLYIYYRDVQTVFCSNLENLAVGRMIGKSLFLIIIRKEGKRSKIASGGPGV